MEKKTIVARVEVLPGKEQAFLQAADALIKGTRAEEGNISYNLYQNPSQPVAFIFYEEYKDQHAMDIHAASPISRLLKGNQGNAGIRFDN